MNAQREQQPPQESREEDFFESDKKCSTISSETLLKWKQNAEHWKVAIVGGGAAGITALKTFLDSGFHDVILLEAQNTLGGRITTFRQGKLHVEDGAEWIHGGKRNIVYRIAKASDQLRNQMSDDQWECKIVREDGSVSDDDIQVMTSVKSIIDETNTNGILSDFYHHGYGEYLTKRFCEEISREGRTAEVLKAWMHFMEQTINSTEGTGNWNDISARDADLFVDFGADLKWKNGYDTLVHYLTRSLKPASYLLNTPVKHILWDVDEAKGALLITSDDRSIAAEKVIVTVSVGCLKKWDQSVFIPSIPRPLKSALQEVQLGKANKVFMGWQKRWWGSKPINVSILWTKFTLPANMEWLYGVVEICSVEEEENLLQTFISGNYSLKMEEKEENEVHSDFLFLLRQLFKRSIAEPSFFRRTAWNSNPWTCGSYSSYITPEGSRQGLHSRSKFRKPLKNRWKETVLYWAGEHTHDSRYGTVDGAMESGLREANRILNQCKLVNSVN